MYSSVCSGGLSGIQSYIASVEIDVSRALPGFDMVGRLANEVKEAKERVRVALKNCSIELPPVKITVNISPADISKSGTAFDLPIAIGVLNSLGHLPDDALKDILIIGELGLMGDIRAVSGVLPLLLKAKECGISRCMIPAANAMEASYVDGIEILAVDNLFEAIEVFTDTSHKSAYMISGELNGYKSLSLSQDTQEEDYQDIIGQESCIRASVIAAAGFHHMLIMGPPGTGKTMIAKRMPSIMPPLSASESLEVSTIYSVSGLLNKERPYITHRPFMNPHHTTTVSSLAGGGIYPRPGIMSLCHKGVLFLDELPEFRRECIEVLREPLEEKHIQISRARSTYTYPADFMLVAASNPCPCGYYPDRNLCNCTDHMISAYRSRISGPIRDRIDIIVSASRISSERIIASSGHRTGQSSAHDSRTLRTQVLKAMDMQRGRFQGTKLRYNSEIPSGLIDKYCSLGAEEQDYMRDVYDTMQLTARSYHKILKVARTIADLDGNSMIGIPHLKEAICYRG